MKVVTETHAITSSNDIGDGWLLSLAPVDQLDVTAKKNAALHPADSM